MVFQYDVSDNSFTAREAFVRLWKTCPFDLYFFWRRDQAKMAVRVKYLLNKMKGLDLPDHRDFIHSVRSGKIDSAVFQKFRSILALQWVMRCGKEAHAKQKNIDPDNDLQEAKSNLQRAKEDFAKAQAKATRIKKKLATGGLLNDEELGEGISFDPFPEDVYPGVGKVDWDAGLLAQLRKPVDLSLPHPKVVRPKDRPLADESAFYVTKEQIFDGIFKVDKKHGQQSEGFATITQMLETKL